MNPDRRDEILALLEERPLGTRRLRTYLGCDLVTLQAELKTMAAEGLVHWDGLDHRWELRAFSPPPAPPVTPGREGSTVQVDKEEIVSVWHGRDPLPGSGEAAGLGSTLAGSSFKVHL